MPTTLLNMRNQLEIAYKISGDPNFVPGVLNLLINQAQRSVQIQLNGLGIKKWEAMASLAVSVEAHSGSLVAGQIYVINAVTGGADFSNVAIVISGTINVPGCKFIANASISPTSWGSGGSVNTVALTSASFIGKSVQSVSVSSLVNMAESPNALRFAEVSDGTDYGFAKEVNEQFAFEHLNNPYFSPTVKNPFYFRVSGNIYFAPATINAAKVHYYRVIADLSADSDVTEMPTEFVEFIIKRAGVEIQFMKNEIKDKDSAISAVNDSITQAYSKFLDKTAQQKSGEKAQLQ